MIGMTFERPKLLLETPCCVALGGTVRIADRWKVTWKTALERLLQGIKVYEIAIVKIHSTAELRVLSCQDFDPYPYSNLPVFSCQFSLFLVAENTLIWDMFHSTCASGALGFSRVFLTTGQMCPSAGSFRKQLPSLISTVYNIYLIDGPTPWLLVSLDNPYCWWNIYPWIKIPGLSL